MQIYIAVMALIAMFAHVILAVYFLNAGLIFVTFVNIADIFLWIVAFMFALTGKTRLASFICMFALIAYSIIATYLLGTGINVHWIALTALVPTAMYFDFSKNQRIFLLASIFLTVNIQIAISHLFPAPYPQYDNLFLEVFFSNIIILGIIIGLILNIVIRRRLAEAHAKELEDFKLMSFVDPLTKLNNRRYSEVFMDRMQRDKMERTCCFALLDIDNFKNVNDTFGHNIGDVVLAKFGEILRENVRNTDLACRWGGEEFLIVLNKCDLETGYIALENIRRTVEQAVVSVDGNDINFTITGGAAVWDDEGLEKTLDICDKNLYIGKRSGKNKIVV